MCRDQRAIVNLNRIDPKDFVSLAVRRNVLI